MLSWRKALIIHYVFKISQCQILVNMHKKWFKPNQTELNLFPISFSASEEAVSPNHEISSCFLNICNIAAMFLCDSVSEFVLFLH